MHSRDYSSVKNISDYSWFLNNMINPRNISVACFRLAEAHTRSRCPFYAINSMYPGTDHNSYLFLGNFLTPADINNTVFFITHE